MTKLEQFLKRSAVEINKELERFFPRKISRQWMKENVSAEEFEFDLETYQKAVVEPVWDFLDRGGKRWRPSLMLLCCEAVGGNRKKALPFVVFPELLHTGSIIVDDVEDNSSVRRGRPAMHKLFGVDIAVNNGNLLYFLPAFLLYSNKFRLPSGLKAKIYDVCLEEMVRLSFGQATDIYWHQGKRTAVSEKQYLQMCTFKTGSLARLSAKLGVILGGGSRKQTEKLGNFAAAIGVAFQIRDDVLNISSSEHIGKDFGDDILEGKRSLIILRTLKKAAKHERNRLLAILGSATGSKPEVAEALKIIKKYDGIEFSKAKAKELVEKSWKEAETCITESSAKSLLREFANYVVERQS